VFPIRAHDDTGADPATVARAYTIAREVFAARAIWAQIEGLDNRIPAAVQYTSMFQSTRLLRHASYWLIENLHGNLDIERAVRRYAAPVSQLWRELDSALSPTVRASIDAQRSQLIAHRVPEQLAARIASVDTMHCALDLAEASMAARVDIGYAAKAYFDVGERIGLAWIKEQIEGLVVEGQWQAAARRTVRDDLYGLQRKITGAVLKCKGRDAPARVDQWNRRHAASVDALKRIIVDLRTGSPPDFATLSVVLQAVRRLAQE
jgi:glutamate dehydrogenase